MRWKGRQQSTNVEDRRGMPRGAVVGGGGLMILVIALIASFMGADPDQVKQIVGQAQMGQPPVQDQQAGSDMVRSGCGPASSAVGPFYCPADQKVYIDPSFFDQLARRHRAPGDFAQAYVIAHEVAHHVQALLGYSDIVQQVRRRGNEVESNRASVRLELQADYLAGVWAHHAHRQFGILERGDIQEAITAANQIGDDTLMRERQVRVVPERFTHGTSAQRTRWFYAGLESGDMQACRALFELEYSRL